MEAFTPFLRHDFTSKPALVVVFIFKICFRHCCVGDARCFISEHLLQL